MKSVGTMQCCWCCDCLRRVKRFTMWSMSTQWCINIPRHKM